MSPINPDIDDQPSEWRKGGPVLLSAIIGNGFGLALFLNTAGLFITPMRQAFGWSASVGTIAPIILLIMAFLSPVVGLLIDRVGARPVAIFGLCAFAGADLLLSMLPNSRPLLYLLVAAIGLIAPTAGGTPFTKGVAARFKRHAGAAFGLTMSGSAIVAVVAGPLTAWVIEKFGWRIGYLALAGMVTFVGLPVVLLFFREQDTSVRAPSAGFSVDGSTLREALRNLRFWTLAVSFGLAALPMGVFLGHLQPLLRSAGFSVIAAASYGSIFALASGIGRIGTGVMLDRYWDYGAAFACILLSAIGSFMITGMNPGTPPWVAGSAVFLIGLTYGGEASYGAYFVLKLFGRRHFAMLFGCMSFIVGGGVALGGIFASAIFDLLGSYSIVGRVCGVFLLLSSFSVLWLGLCDLRRSRGLAKYDEMRPS